MISIRKTLELLAPAKNLLFGKEAILHGADAVYIGGPAFGARSGAGNPVADIENLADFAHRYHARVLVALNTILRDDELEDARRLAWQTYEAGADALIIQDMGLLELDLPPIELHASTQTDIRTPEKARFLQDCGFSQIVLARELALPQIRAIAEKTEVTLEYFVHGALCVSYSGLCNLSQATTGRSANRGDCSQACRLPYTLIDGEGKPIARDKHLLSLKDNDQSANLQPLIDAGIRSFKIEGRLKDLSYVKNITAHYRILLDSFLAEHPEFCRSSSGTSTFSFTPQPEKTFNRGSTDYFLNERRDDIGAFDSPKFIGETLGTVRSLGRQSFDLDTVSAIHNGDGITFFPSGPHSTGELVGLRINRAEPIPGGYRLWPSLSNGRLPTELLPGTAIRRNHDQDFERRLDKESAHRLIPVRIQLSETTDGFALDIIDDRDICATATIVQAHEPAHDDEGTRTRLRESLSKLGSTPYRAGSITLDLAQAWFIPAAVLNGLRRSAVEALDRARKAAYTRLPRRPAVEPPVPYIEDALNYLGNVFNEKSRRFYERHGVRVIEPAYECHQEKGEVSLMITRHCLRYSFNLCPKQIKGIAPTPMLLQNGNETLTLRFDCKPCEMHVIGRLRTRRSIPITIQADSYENGRSG